MLFLLQQPAPMLRHHKMSSAGRKLPIHFMLDVSISYYKCVSFSAIRAHHLVLLGDQEEK